MLLFQTVLLFGIRKNFILLALLLKEKEGLLNH